MQLAEQQMDFSADRVVHRELYHETQLVEEPVEFSLERSETRVDEPEALFDVRKHLSAGRASVQTKEAPEEVKERGKQIADVDVNVDIRVDIDVHV